MSESLFPTRIVEMEKGQFQNPLVIGGFAEAGLVGVATVSYITDQLRLHQIAYVKSEHIPPVAVFIGERLRRAFRIYADGNRKLVVLVCEAPIDIHGLYEISSVLVDWFEEINAREVAVIDGIPFRGMPERRETYFVAEEEKCAELKKKGFKLAQTAVIGGMGGSILSECIGRQVVGLSILTPTSIDMPDPGAVHSIRTINALYQLNINTTELERNVVQLNQYLSTLSEERHKLETQTRMKPEAIYG